MSWNDGQGGPFAQPPQDQGAARNTPNEEREKREAHADSAMPALPSLSNNTPANAADGDDTTTPARGWNRVEGADRWPSPAASSPAASSGDDTQATQALERPQTAGDGELPHETKVFTGNVFDRDAQPTVAFGRGDAPAQQPRPFQAEAPATQQFGAPPAAYPGDANQYAAPQQAGGSPGGRDAHPTPAPKRRKPLWKRPAFIIGAAAAILLIAAAAIGIPWYLHTQKVQRGDELAAEFDAGVQKYESAWSKENIAAVTAPSISGVFAGPRENFSAMPAGAVRDLATDCEQLADANDHRQQLADAELPELKHEDGVDASEQYQQAQARADELASSRDSAETFLTASESYLTSLQQLCDHLPAYAEIDQDYRHDESETLPATYVTPKGQALKTPDGSISYPCEAENGCPDLLSDDNREKFAAAYEATYVDYYAKLAEALKTNCFLDAFQSACDVGATEYQKASDAHKAVVDHLRTTQPTVKVGEPIYPEFSKLYDAALAAETAAETAFTAEWDKVAPGAGGDMSRTGQSLATYLDSLQSSAQDAAKDLAS